MPWKKLKGGFTKAGKKKGKGGFIENTKQYEALRKKGMSKKEAASISNSFKRNGHKGRK